MCGRAYQTFTDDELEARYQTERRKKDPFFPIHPNYNLSPTQKSPVILQVGDHREIRLMRWGLIPAWAPDVASASKYSLINARGEEIEQKRSYKQAFQKRRCLVPISGFYEWHRSPDGKTKKPYAIHGAQDEILSLAGIYESWVSKETGEIIDSFAIVTIGANRFMSAIHDRMPVLLDSEHESMWLDPHLQTPQQLKPLLKAAREDALASHVVSTRVNSPRNNDAELICPLVEETDK